MKFIDSNLETVLPYFDKLSADTKPLWGSMNAQQMVEHLVHTIEMALGKHKYELEIKSSEFDNLRAFILSDKPLPRNFQAVFAPKNPKLKFEEIELAVDAYCEAWIDLENLAQADPKIEFLHPHFGPLNYELFKRLHEKHLTHHFTQFGLIKDEAE